jgi:hypothetical protein
MCGDARATWEDADASLYRSTYKFEMSSDGGNKGQARRARGGWQRRAYLPRKNTWLGEEEEAMLLLHQRRRQRRGETSAEKVITHFSFLFR